MEVIKPFQSKENHENFISTIMANSRRQNTLFRLRIYSLMGKNLNIQNLPAPEIIAKEIVENLESALEQFTSIEEELTTR